MSKYLFQIWNEKNKKKICIIKFVGTTDAIQLSGTYTGTHPYKEAKKKPKNWDYSQGEKNSHQWVG
jgi:hypothetical protein